MMMLAVLFMGDERNDKGETSVKFIDEGGCCVDKNNCWSSFLTINRLAFVGFVADSCCWKIELPTLPLEP